jgi:DNA-binding MarR family transcriptional regulator
MDPAAPVAATVADALARLRRAPARRADAAVVEAVGRPPAQGGEVTVSLVAERLGLDLSRASRLVADAVDGGLVDRRASRRDARRAHLSLTEAGRRARDAAVAARQAEVDRALAGWSVADQRALADLLGRFAAALGQDA